MIDEVIRIGLFIVLLPVVLGAALLAIILVAKLIVSPFRLVGWLVEKIFGDEVTRVRRRARRHKCDHCSSQAVIQHINGEYLCASCPPKKAVCYYCDAIAVTYSYDRWICPQCLKRGKQGQKPSRSESWDDEPGW
jgi:hypothetical protein